MKAFPELTAAEQQKLRNDFRDIVAMMLAAARDLFAGIVAAWRDVQLQLYADMLRHDAAGRA